MYQITVTDKAGQRVSQCEWVTDRCTFGSTDDNLVQLKSWRVARQHMALTSGERGLSIEDLSGKGVWVNDGKVTDTRAIEPGDQIRVGPFTVQLELLTPVAAVPKTVDHAASEASRNTDLLRLGSLVHGGLLTLLDQRRIQLEDRSDSEIIDTIGPLIDEVITNLPEAGAADQAELKQVVMNETVGLGALEVLLSDSSVTEVMVNNFDDIYVERGGRLERSTAQFTSPNAVMSVIDRIISPLGRRIDESSPIVDARLKDGSRVNAIIPPLALRGPSITIRKFPEKRFETEDLIRFGTLDANMAELLHQSVVNRCNIIVSGGTGSGKTTLLNVLSNYIPAEERVITVEDAAELQLGQPHVVSLEARPANMEGKGQITIRDLVKNCLRMRPDRIVVGECRGGEALDMLQAMNTGHDGSLTTAHANNPGDMLRRLEVMVLMAGMDLPISAIREQIASAVDIIVQQNRFGDGSRRITKISEVTGMESGTIQLNDIFVFKQQGFDEDGRVRGQFQATGSVPTFYEALRERGIQTNMEIFSHD
ncbi:ATPase, T2SS/T4P/T4SS family [Litorivicinus lipolyticus]|uniref:ATPase, T2SS/T4P/T4SS family n=1 Tax=Litorivicinus lipolyticus TaxID=418701 RepID=UPI003B5ABA7F